MANGATLNDGTGPALGHARQDPPPTNGDSHDPGKPATADQYIDRTAKLIPAEAVALFVPFATMVDRSGLTGEAKQWFVLALAIGVGLIVPLILRKLRGVRDWKQYVVSVMAFVLWVLNVRYDALPTPWGNHEAVTLAVALLLGLFTFAAPLFVKTSSQP